MTITITEYGGMASGPLPIAQEPCISSYTLAVTSDAGYSTRPFDPATNYIRVHTDAICKIAVVASTSATMTGFAKRMSAETTEYFGVRNGNVLAAASTS
jgi:hypothetical protein